jgi:hypothetical protein
MKITFFHSLLFKDEVSEDLYYLPHHRIKLQRKISTMSAKFLTTHSGLSDNEIRPETSSKMEISFAVFNHLYILFSFVKLAES